MATEIPFARSVCFVSAEAFATAWKHMTRPLTVPRHPIRNVQIIKAHNMGIRFSFFTRTACTIKVAA
jgi:hypothetical protein